MSDAMTEFFTAASGSAAQLRVKTVRFAPETHKIHFDMGFEATRLPYQRCATQERPIHDRPHCDWQHLHFFQDRALIHAKLPRVRRGGCGEPGDSDVQQAPAPWARVRSGLTCCSRQW